MHKRRRKAEMAASTIAMLASPNATAKGGGSHVLLFVDLCPPFESSQQSL